MRLMVWGREWGVVEGKLDAHIAASGGNDGLRTMAEMILKQLYETVTDFRKLQDRYGIKEDKSGSTPSEEKTIPILSSKGVPVNPTEKLPEPPKRSTREELKLRARWVIQDKNKFQFLLTDLKDFNDGLERLFPPARIATFQRTWTNELLSTAKRDINQLHLLETASSGTYPQLNNSASLKQLRINLDASELKPFKPTSSLKIPLSAIARTADPPPKSNRQVGTFTPTAQLTAKAAQISNVLIEYLPYDADLDIDSRLHLLQRVDNLARMSRSASSRHPDLHTLDCAGYLDDSTENRYGLVYLLPSTVPSGTEPTTLTSIIDNLQLRTPDLGARFKLAHTLAVALWSLHSLDWLHKTFCSSNILFFSSPPANTSSSGSGTVVSASTAPASLVFPFLSGFDSSRPQLAHSQTSPSRNLHQSDIYRHPSSLGLWRQPYSAAFDIYSLGLVLLELGLWKSLRPFHKPKYTPQQFCDKVIRGVLVPGLGAKTGARYREVVERCLDAGSKEGGSERLLEWVVGSLEELRV